MAQPRELTEVKLDHMAGKIASANEAREQAKQLIAFAEKLEAEIKEEMEAAGAEQATVFGVPAFTYQYKNAYSFAKFRDDHPHIYRNYLVTQEQQVLDKDKLLAEQGDILKDYQTREFRRVNRNPGT